MKNQKKFSAVGVLVFLAHVVLVGLTVVGAMGCESEPVGACPTCDAGVTADTETRAAFTVALSPDTPSAQVVAGTAVNVAVLKFRGLARRDVLVSEFVIRRTGLGTMNDVAGVELWSGGMSFGSGALAPNAWVFRPGFIMPAGSTREWTLYATFNAESQTVHEFNLIQVALEEGEVEGLPVRGDAFVTGGGETCNGVDDDGDGVTDECPLANEVCEEGRCLGRRCEFKGGSGNECNVWRLSPDGECSPAEDGPDGIPCDDGDACTSDTVCSDGSCEIGSRMDCNDGDPCTEDVCGATGCEHRPNDGNPCFDGNGCHASRCRAGVCTVFESVPGCIPCSLEGEDCSRIMQCSEGVGFGATVIRGTGFCHDNHCEAVVVESCDDHDPCTVDTCDALTPPLWREGSGCSHTLTAPEPMCTSCSSDADCASSVADIRCHPAFGCVEPAAGYYPILVVFPAGSAPTSVRYVVFYPYHMETFIPTSGTDGRTLRSPDGTETVLVDFVGRSDRTFTREAFGSCQFVDGSRQPLHWLDERMFGRNAWGCSVNDPMRW